MHEQGSPKATLSIAARNNLAGTHGEIQNHPPHMMTHSFRVLLLSVRLALTLHVQPDNDIHVGEKIT